MLPAPAPSPAPTPVPSTAHTPVGRLRRRRRLIAIGLAACGLVAVAVVGVWFQPQKLFIDRRVDEASPLSIAASQGAAGVRPDGTASAIAASGTALRDEGPSMSSGEAAPTATATATAGAAAQTTAGAAETADPTAGATPPAPSIRAVGSFTSLAHHTTGEVVVIDQPDGTSIVRFEDLDTTDGPDLRVLLTAAGTAQDPAPGAVELGRLKGNQGSQNYTVPDGTDLTATPQVVIWCARFNVAFGTAVLEPRP